MSEIRVLNSCFSRVLGLFGSCFSCYFGSTIVFFKKNVLATLQSVLYHLFSGFSRSGIFGKFRHSSSLFIKSSPRRRHPSKARVKIVSIFDLLFIYYMGNIF